MNRSPTSTDEFDRIYVYNGTPPALRASGPYLVEAFFETSTPQDEVLDAVHWLIRHEIPHEARIETLDREEGFFLQISFPTDDLRNTFIQHYRLPAH